MAGSCLKCGFYDYCNCTDDTKLTKEELIRRWENTFEQQVKAVLSACDLRERVADLECRLAEKETALKQKSNALKVAKEGIANTISYMRSTDDSLKARKWGVGRLELLLAAIEGKETE